MNFGVHLQLSTVPVSNLKVTTNICTVGMFPQQTSAACVL